MTTQRWRPNKKVAAGIPIFFLLLSVGMCTVGASKPAKSNTEVHMGIHPTDADFRENLILLGSEHGDYQNAVAWFKCKQVGPLLMAALQEGRITPLQRGRIIETLGEIGEDKAIPMLVVTLGVANRAGRPHKPWAGSVHGSRRRHLSNAFRMNACPLSKSARKPSVIFIRIPRSKHYESSCCTMIHRCDTTP